MVAVGGIPPSLPIDSFTKDPWRQGLRVFDMTALEWVDGYDANAQAYETPQVVKEYIEMNGRYPAEWNDDVIRGWVMREESECA